jgi:hypothetical protein
MIQKIEHARRQARDAYARAEKPLDTQMREEWLRVAAMWEALATEYQRFSETSTATLLTDP